jgi:serine/alanine adding enzyme
MNFTIVNSLDEKVWRRFVDQHPQGNVFHTPEMFEVFAQAKGHRPTLWAAMNNNQQPLALLLPVQVSLLNGVLRRFTTRDVVYGGVLCASGAEGKAALALLLSTYKRDAAGGALFTELRNQSDLSDIQPVLQDQGFALEPHLNFLIDLRRPSEEIKRSMHRNVMSNVRKAQRMGVAVEDITSPDKLPAVYAVLAKVYEQIQIPLAPLSLVESAFKILYPRHMIKFLAARVNDNVVGVAIHLLYNDMIYAWYAGALRDYASYKAHDLLNWHMLEWGAQNGFRRFDFGGAGKPDQSYGPREYKAKFGGQLVEFGRNTYVHSQLRLRISQQGYRVYRRFL